MHPTIISRDEHTVSRKQMCEEVLKVLYRLHCTGHLAYLCGGGVRDLLVGRDIDDFDVVTDAEPKRLRQVFGNCRLVGRRFRIAHIIFKGGKIIEVSTFRKKGQEEEAAEGSNSLLIRCDNTYGSPAEDAFRRDFTINALFYNVADYTIIDYVGGRADLQKRLIRSIGDPDIRFQEDPVRILRGIRLAAALDFMVEEQTWEAMKRQGHHILECPASRIRDEIMKMTRRQGSSMGFELLHLTGVLKLLLPKLDEFRLSCHENQYDPAYPAWCHLEAVDHLRDQGKEFTDAVLLAALTAAPMLASFESLPSGYDIGRWAHQYLELYFKPLAVPRIVRTQVHLLHLALRHMVAPKKKKRRQSLRRSSSFSDALRLLEIHCHAAPQHWPALHRWQRPQAQPRPRRARAKKYISRRERIP